MWGISWVRVEVDIITATDSTGRATDVRRIRILIVLARGDIVDNNFHCSLTVNSVPQVRGKETYFTYR